MELYFNSLSDFFAMGGHGYYIWLCYAIVFIAFLVQYFFAVKGVAHSKKILKRHFKRLATRQETEQSKN